MSLPELFLIALGLSMDAFAISICKGLSMQRMDNRSAFIIGLYFGTFQAFMPFLGYLLGSRFQNIIASYDHWIAFILLAVIGGNMVKESLNKEEESLDPSIAFPDMIILAVATSIDALAAGVTFAFLKVRITAAISFIGVFTFILSMVGVKIGNTFGIKYKSKSESAGGMILIFMGLKILVEHLF